MSVSFVSLNLVLFLVWLFFFSLQANPSLCPLMWPLFSSVHPANDRHLAQIPVADLRDQVASDAAEPELTLQIFSIAALGAAAASHS